MPDKSRQLLSCPACGAARSLGAKFCSECGAALSTASPARLPQGYTPPYLAEKILKSRASLQGERKRITVLFADIKGSTDIAERVGAENWHLILDGLFELLAGAVHRYEGTVNQYTGDGVMALFGAPITHEDHADRACLAAWHMQQAMQNYAREVQHRHDIEITLRVGLNSGEVVVGRIGDDLRMDYTAQGLTVHLAQRMENLCEPGRVVLTQNTATRLRGRFPLKPLGPQAVRGVSQPVTAFELEGAASALELERHLTRTRFIGRERELGNLRQVLQELRTGKGLLATVSGNAGLGKSRLCREFLGAARDDGIHCIRAWCSPYSRAYPLAPVKRLLRERLQIDEALPPAEAMRRAIDAFDSLDLPEREQLLTLWLDLLELGANQKPSAAPTPGQHARLLSAAVQVLLKTESQQVLLVEDMHWADPATEDFLKDLAARIRHSPTLLLLNFRPEYRPDWNTKAATRSIVLEELAGVDLQTFSQVLLGTGAGLREVAQRIVQHTRGNPFFIEEAVRDLRETGYLLGEPGALRLARPIDQWQIPDSVHALLAARIDRLPDDQKTILQAAAVIGLRAGENQLLWLLGMTLDDLQPSLRALEAAGFFQAHPDVNELRFCHPLIQEVAYSTQLEAHRRQTHARLAAELERLHPADGSPHESWIAAAHHWGSAGEWVKAGLWHLKVARWRTSPDPDAAAAGYREAARTLDLAPESAEVLSNRIAARSGMLLQLQFRPLPDDEVERVFKEAQQIAMKTRNFTALGELFIAYTIALLQRGQAAAAKRLMSDVVNQAIAMGAGATVSRFRMTVLLVFACAGFPREGLELVNKATSIAWLTEPIGEDNFVSRGFYGFMQCWLGELAAARVNLRDAAKFSERDDGAAWVESFHADYAWLSGDTSQILQKAELAAKRAESYGAPFMIAIARRGLGLALTLNGEAERAIPLLEEYLPIMSRGGAAHQFEGLFLATLAKTHIESKNWDDAARVAEAAIASSQRSQSRLWEAIAWLAWLDLPPDDSRAVRSAEGLARLQELIDAIGAEGLRPWWWLAKARWSADTVDAAQCHEQAHAAFLRIGAAPHAQRMRNDPSAY